MPTRQPTENSQDTALPFTEQDFNESLQRIFDAGGRPDVVPLRPPPRYNSWLTDTLSRSHEDLLDTITRIEPTPVAPRLPISILNRFSTSNHYSETSEIFTYTIRLELPNQNYERRCAITRTQEVSWDRRIGSYRDFIVKRTSKDLIDELLALRLCDFHRRELEQKRREFA